MSSTPTESNSKQSQLDIKGIVKLLPHRYPFLLVDRILECDLEKDTITGLKNLTYNELFFQGHFPDAPIMPGVLILEAMAQTGSVLISQKIESNKIAVLMNVNEAKFRHPVRPGDQLIIRCEGIHFSSKGGRIKAFASVGEKVAAQAEIGFALADRSQL